MVKGFIEVKTREHGSIKVFKSKDGKQFLRIGDRESVAREVALQKDLIRHGFPVPHILAEGEDGREAYYIEQSLGERHLSDIFHDEYAKTGKISDVHFDSLLLVTKKFMEAQFTTAKKEHDHEGLFLNVMIPMIQRELPELSDQAVAAYRMAVQKTTRFPFLLSHGDLNPHNMFERGVIDFGNAHDAPFGYDLVCSVYQEYNFPATGDYESMRWFEFSEEQIEKYFSEMDSFFENNGLSKLSDFKEDFIVLRAIRSTARIGSNTNLRRWRAERLAKMLEAYSSGASIMDTVVHFN